jgi:hypothetical protein
MNYAVDNAVFQWEDGFRKLQAARSDPLLHRALARAVVAVQDQLRKHLGSSFSVDELASLYSENPDWGFDLVIQSAPEDIRAWDTSTAVDAAFYLYMREAMDFAGGSAPR